MRFILRPCATSFDFFFSSVIAVNKPSSCQWFNSTADLCLSPQYTVRSAMAGYSLLLLNLLSLIKKDVQYLQETFIFDCFVLFCFLIEAWTVKLSLSFSSAETKKERFKRFNAHFSKCEVTLDDLKLTSDTSY